MTRMPSGVQTSLLAAVTPPTESQGGGAGFTLIEILIALTITGIVLPDEQQITAAASGTGTSGSAAESTPQARATLVLDRLAGLRFRYLDGQSGQWVNDWDTTEQDTLNRLPAAVEVAVFLYDDKG